MIVVRQVLLIQFFLFSVNIFAADLYLAPAIGSTSLSVSNGSQTRTNSFSYGAESMIFQGHLGAGLNYVDYVASDEGTSAIHVTQENRWLMFEAKYRFWNEDLSPYVTAGAGPVFTSVTTQVLNQTEKNSGTDFIYDFGIEIFGRVGKNFGYGISGKYFQYLNVNGFNYLLSLGYVLPGLF